MFVRRTPSFGVQFWGKKVRLIHETVRYFGHVIQGRPHTLISLAILTHVIRSTQDGSSAYALGNFPPPTPPPQGPLANTPQRKTLTYCTDS